jgi:uncharacterized protein (DUF1330 family)
MSVYFLAEIEKINNTEMYHEYAEKAASIIVKFGGKYIFKSECLKPLSEVWGVKRIILIEFEDINKLQHCFQSEEYKKIKHLRENSVKSKAVIIE